MRLPMAAVMAAFLFASPAAAACVTPAEFAALWQATGGKAGTPKAVDAKDRETRDLITEQGAILSDYDALVPLTDAGRRPWIAFVSAGCFVGAFRLSGAPR